MSSERRVGRVTIVERPDALVVTSPFLPRVQAIVLLCSMVAAFIGLWAVMQPTNVTGLAMVFVICGYFGLILGLNRTIATVQHDKIVVRRGPVPLWPPATIPAAQIVSIDAKVVTGITGRGGRMVVDTVAASLTNSRSATVIDDTGDAGDARTVAATITEWLAAHAE